MNTYDESSANVVISVFVAGVVLKLSTFSSGSGRN